MKALAIWIGLITSNAAQAGSADWVLFQAKSLKNPHIQFVVTRSQDSGTTGLLWKGDYLWARCSQHLNERRFNCGTHTVEWDPLTGRAALNENGKPSQRMRPLYFANDLKHRGNG